MICITFMKSNIYKYIVIKICTSFQIFPVCYALMTSKSQDCYTALFKYIDEVVFHMQPDEIITDFEDGLRSAIRKQWPKIILRGCWYHYCVCICKKFISLGLGSLLKTNGFARQIKDMLLCLPLLPTALFNEGLSHIKSKAASRRLSAKLNPFFKYFTYWEKQVQDCLR